VTCRLGHMFVTLWLVSPGPLFPLTCQVAVTGAGDCRLVVAVNRTKEARWVSPHLP